VLLTVSIGFFLVMLAAIGGAGYYLWVRSEAGATADGPTLARWTFEDVAAPASLPNWLRTLAELGSLVKVSEADALKAKRDLAAAGYRYEQSVAIFQGCRVAGMIGVPILAAVLLYAINPDIVAVTPAVLATAYMAYRLPDNVLRRRIEKRKAKLYRGLPDLLDLLVIQVESGLSLEQALADTARDLRLAHPCASSLRY
jgi:tight adherence protein C